MGLIELFIQVVLRHILPGRAYRSNGDGANKAFPDTESDSDEDDLNKEALSRSRIDSKRRSDMEKSIMSPSEMLDFSGPKLICGYNGWLLFLQIIGQINWIGKPLYLSIIYKLIVFCIASYCLFYRLLGRLYSLTFPDGGYRNPIFIFITLAGSFTIMIQILVNVKLNLLDLCPVFKILQTPRLCFLRQDVLHKLGNQTLTVTMILHVYVAFVMNLLAAENFTELVANFSLLNFLLDCFSVGVYTYYIMGICAVDFYIRSAFGHWLMALRSHLELRFTQAHRRERRLKRSANLASRAWSCCSGQSRMLLKRARADVELIGTKQQLEDNQPPAAFDQIQRNLNNMDDHLEVLRSIQEVSLVGISLMTFLVNGSLFLFVYNLIANQRDYYRGSVFLVLALSYIYVTFICYFGDRWVYYALGSFVQTVEDEYFMQSNMFNEAHAGSQSHPAQNTNSHEDFGANKELFHDDESMLIIRKKDVLFCREFLHQFENHLATPWSQLTFKSHLHILRTFVTLMAAQIIFDHEH